MSVEEIVLTIEFGVWVVGATLVWLFVARSESFERCGPPATRRDCWAAACTWPMAVLLLPMLLLVVAADELPKKWRERHWSQRTPDGPREIEAP